MTKEQRRARRDMLAERRHVRVVKIKKSTRCQCDNPAYDFCDKHGRATS